MRRSSRHGFRENDERGVGSTRSQQFVATPNRFMTYSVHAYDDGTAIFSWEFAIADYLANHDDPDRLRRGAQPVHVPARGRARPAGRRLARQRDRPHRARAGVAAVRTARTRLTRFRAEAPAADTSTVGRHSRIVITLSLAAALAGVAVPRRSRRRTRRPASESLPAPVALPGLLGARPGHELAVAAPGRHRHVASTCRCTTSTASRRRRPTVQRCTTRGRDGRLLPQRRHRGRTGVPTRASSRAPCWARSNGWPGERWLDIRQLRGRSRPIMRARIATCAREKGFDAVELDNVDGYPNHTGFPLTGADQLRYNAVPRERGAPPRHGGRAEERPRAGPGRCCRTSTSRSTSSASSTTSATAAAVRRRRQGRVHGRVRLELAEFCPQAADLGFNSMKKKLSLRVWRDPCP